MRFLSGTSLFCGLTVWLRCESVTTPVGNLRRRYSVRGRSTDRNELGERESAYTHKFYIRAEAPREGSATIRGESGVLRSEDSLRLRTRYRTDIDLNDQLVDGSTVYYVRSILDLSGRRRWLQMTVSLTPGGI